MSGIYGKAAPQAIYPGWRGLLMGLRSVPGFFGSGGSGAPNLASVSPETLPASTASGPVVIAAAPQGHPPTQRQLIWRVFPTGSVNLNLQVSIDDVDANYITIDNYTGSSNSGSRVIAADIGSSAPPGPQLSIKILSSARFIRVKEGSGTASATAICDCVSQ
jgi:hypothetical protein